MKIMLMAFVVMTIQSTVFAAERSFVCKVSSFNYTRVKDFGIGAWKYQMTQTYTAPVKNFNGEYSELTQTLKVVGPYEIIFDVRWEATTLSNDDVSIKHDPKLRVEARLQERMSNGRYRILDTAIVTGRPDYASQVTHKLFAEVQLTSLVALSEHLVDPKISNFNIAENLKGVDVEGQFSFACNTGL
ncbi:MAG: hypothetical protein IPK04_07575 [Bdellovibrionales bacterium]|nr:hypothetical protein [Bdellovibrionales bacterium]